MTAWLPVVAVDSAHVDVAGALRWLGSWGAPELQLVAADVSVPDARQRFGSDGGMASGRFNSQALVREVIAALDPQDRRALAAAPERIVLITPLGFHPHVWQPRDGGVALGAGRWLRRYAVLPHGSPLGHVAHELGHLLYDWPDLDKVRGLGRACLMARGADGEPAPAPPCAALRVRAGWCVPAQVTLTTSLDAVTGVFCWEQGAFRVVGERVGDMVYATRVDERGVPVQAASAVADRSALGALLEVFY